MSDCLVTTHIQTKKTFLCWKVELNWVRNEIITIILNEYHWKILKTIFINSYTYNFHSWAHKKIIPTTKITQNEKFSIYKWENWVKYCMFGKLREWSRNIRLVRVVFGSWIGKITNQQQAEKHMLNSVEFYTWDRQHVTPSIFICWIFEKKKKISQKNNFLFYQIFLLCFGKSQSVWKLCFMVFVMWKNCVWMKIKKM